MFISKQPPAIRMRRPSIILAIALCMAWPISGCSDTDTPEQEDVRVDSVADDATAEALRAIAMATNAALAEAEQVPAPVNALSRSENDDDSSFAPEDVAPYEVQGSESEPAAVAAAAAGRIGRPLLAMFRTADCPTCDANDTELAELVAERSPRLAFVTVDMDDPEAELVTRRFNVSQAPTFVMLNSAGRTLGHFSEWPGADLMAAYLDQLD
jgi:hypothetical protein